MTARSGCLTSRFGGLTVAQAVIDLLPDENLVYIGDTGRYPYGPQPLDEVREFAQQIAVGVRWAEHNVKMVVVACNTAAAAGLDRLRSDGEPSRSPASSNPGCGRPCGPPKTAG